MNEIFLELATHFNPDKHRLWTWVNTWLTDEMLREISEADYGHHSEEYYKALKQIQHTQIVPRRIEYVPLEVLHLVYFCNPDEDRFRPCMGLTGHQLRIFASMLLVIESVNLMPHEDDVNGDSRAVIKLVESTIKFGKEPAEHALSFLTWRMLRIIEFEKDDPFTPFAILLLSIFLHKFGQQDDWRLQLLAEWVLESTPPPRRSVLGMTIHDKHTNSWKKLTEQLILSNKKLSPELLVPMQGIVAKFQVTEKWKRR